MPERGIQGVARVVEAVVRVELVTVLDPHAAAPGQHDVGGQAQPGPGQLPDRVGCLDVPGEIAVVVADRIDNLPTALGDGGQRRAQVIMLAEDLRRCGLRVAEQFQDVPGQHDRDRASLGRQPVGDDLARPAGHIGAFRRQVQVADRQDQAAGRDRDVEQFRDVGVG